MKEWQTLRKNYLNANDLMKITGVSKSKATNIIRELNAEMESDYLYRLNVSMKNYDHLKHYRDDNEGDDKEG